MSTRTFLIAINVMFGFLALYQQDWALAILHILLICITCEVYK